MANVFRNPHRWGTYQIRPSWMRCRHYLRRSYGEFAMVFRNNHPLHDLLNTIEGGTNEEV